MDILVFSTKPAFEGSHFDDFLDRCKVVAVDPSGDDQTSLTVESTSVDDADWAIDNGVNPEEQVGETTPSIPTPTESPAEGDVSDTVDLEDNADAPVTTHPDTQPEALNADDKHSDTAACACTDNANVTSETDAQSSQIEKTTPDDNGSDKLPSSDAESLVKAGVADSLATLVQSLLGQEQEHKTLKMECSKELEKASLPNLDLITSVLPTPTYPQHYPTEDFLGLCAPTKETSEGYFVRRTTPEFPTHILYPWMQKHVKAIASSLPVHEAAPTFAIYGLGSTCIRGTAVLELKNQNGRQLYCNFWITFTALPGNKKSGLINLVFQPVKDLQNKLAKEAIELYDAGNPRNWQRLTIGKFTLPALAEILSASPDGITILTSEIAGLLQSCYEVTYRSELCTMYDGDPWPVEKKQKTPIYIPRALVSIIGCIPMKLLVAPYKHHEPSGFIDRFIFVPLSAHKPNFISVQPDLTEAKHFFQKCVDVLVSHTGSNVPPTVYNVSDEAWELYTEWANYYELELFDTPYHQRFQKTKDQVLKLSFSGHILDTKVVKNVTDLTVSKYDMSIACGIGSWMVESFKQLHNQIFSMSSFDLSKTKEIKEELLNVIQMYAYTDDKGITKISNYDIFKNTQSYNEDDVKKVFKSLGLEATTSCKQSNGKFGRGQLVPPELLKIS